MTKELRLQSALCLVCCALIAACGGIEVVSGGTDAGGADAGHDAASDAAVEDAGRDASDVDARAEAGGDAATEADAVVAVDAAADTAPAVDSGDGGDGGETPVDAGSDAAPVDDGGADAAEDAFDASPANDGATDGGTAACSEGAKRCSAFKSEICSGGTWVPGGQLQCCVGDAGRFVVTGGGSTVLDNDTGLTWQRDYGVSSAGGITAACAGVMNDDGGFRPPTQQELLGIVIGPAVNGLPVCSPSIDRVAFPLTTLNYVYCSTTGAVDFNSGLAAAPRTTYAFRCVRP